MTLHMSAPQHPTKDSSRSPSEPEHPAAPPNKRARVTLACQRCKTRKQKCDGQHPACASCQRFDIECQYITPLVPKPGERKLYIKALEDRVAELESMLTGDGRNAVVSEDHWKHGQSEDEIDSLLGAVRDLSLYASGYYVGGTSTITLGRVLGSVINSHSHSEPLVRASSDEPEDPNPKHVFSETLAHVMGPMFVSPGVADRLLQGYIKHISTRFPFIHSRWIRDLHARRNNLEDGWEKSMLHLVYATGGRFLETTGETGNFFSDQHYDTALSNLPTIIETRDTRSISYMLLLAIYCLRAPREPGAWTWIGMAMRLQIQLGFHRKSILRGGPTLKSEMRKRIFWSTYYLDREVSIALGRPPSISDHDIDCELPFDINEETDDPIVIRQAAECVMDYPMNPPTTLTSFIHHLRLKKIESEIQHTIYRVDKTTPASYDVIEAFLERLRVWKATLPFDSRVSEDQSMAPVDGTEVYMVPYHKCIRLLLYPQLSEKVVNMKYLKQCADACGGVCESYKRLHHTMAVGYSPLSLQSVFLAGLTLIYCTWLSPANSINVLSPLTDCSIMLYVMTERWPSARKYRDVFETIKRSVIDLISQGLHEPRKAVDISSSHPLNIQASFQTLDHEIVGNGTDFSHMISEMTGESVGGFFEGEGNGVGMGMEFGSLMQDMEGGGLGLGLGNGGGVFDSDGGAFENALQAGGFGDMGSAGVDWSTAANDAGVGSAWGR